jgi:hypothetical protein
MVVMEIFSLVHLVQAEPEIAAQLERIANLQRWMMISVGLITLALVAVGLSSVYLLFTARRMISDANATFHRLAPQLKPSLERAQRTLGAVSETAENVRARVEDITATFDEANQALREAGRAAEVRVRELAAVIDVVREEAQELLLDGAATAHGIHTTAKALRAPRPTGQALRPEPPPPLPEEVRRTSHGQG